MKHIIYILFTIVVIGLLSGCADYASGTNTIDADELATLVAEKIAEEGYTKEVVEVEKIVEVEAECEDTGVASLHPMLPIIHINGELHETDEEMYVMFEFKTLRYTKYQVSYLSCTCRPADLNYRQVMYIELDNADGKVRTMTFDADGDEGHYHPGTWGDSSPIPVGPGHTYEEFKTDLIDGYFIGKTPAELLGMSTVSDMNWELADSYVGNSVSTNNMLRAVQTIQAYHLSK